jgi:hypothetical protein
VPKIEYNDRGIAKGVDLGFSPMKLLKKSISPTKSTPDAVRDFSKAASRVNVSVKNKPRKNGVYQGPSIKVGMDKEKSEERNPTAADRYADSLEKRGRQVKADTSRKEYEKKQSTTIKAEQKARGGKDKGVVGDTERAYRIKNKQYKGKYWGPDEFKGDLDKVRAWEKAGRPKSAKERAKIKSAADRRATSKGD